MTRLTYYSPIPLGALLAAVLLLNYRGSLPDWPGWQIAGLVLWVALLAGVLGQILLFGSQGVFAQVLPVPGGRSIRGGGAVLAGGLTLLMAAAAGMGVLLAFEHLYRTGAILAIIAAAAAAAAIATYAWNVPAAVRDFGPEA